MSIYKFDFSSKQDIDGELLEYGWIEGNGKIVVIKAGLGGDFLGYENKYARIAHRLNQRHGCSVLSISNPNNKRIEYFHDTKIITDFVSFLKPEKPELYFFGSSNGCVKGLEAAVAGIDFCKMVLVNMPLMINFHKTVKMISALPKTEILAVYGDKDPSFSYTPFLKGKGENLNVSIVSGADHNFKGYTEEFISLSDKMLPIEPLRRTIPQGSRNNS